MTSLLIAAVLLGQGAPANPVIAELDLDRVEVSQALRATFEAAGISPRLLDMRYEVRGVVTISVKRTRFEAALRLIASQVDGGIELRDGRYLLFHKDHTPTNVPVSVEVTGADPMRVLDALFTQAGVASKVEAVRPRDKTIDVTYTDTKFEIALAMLLSREGLRYRVEKGLYIVCAK